MPRRHPSRPAARPNMAPGSSLRPPCVFCGDPVSRSRVTCPGDWHRLPERLRTAWNQARAEGDPAGIERAREAIRRYARQVVDA
jgi:hypothetical protein